jgi:outer membrane receptor protein involved in Fe transport
MSVLKVLFRGSDSAGGSVGYGRTISHSLLLTLSMALASPCNAQDSDADVAEEAIEEIVVTGSRIKRRDFNTPSPLTTISSEDIEFSGQATIEETLYQMPQVLAGFGRTSNNPGTGTASVNLRGLGDGRSLILLNNRRVAPSGIGNAVDLNNIPQFLIDRVEIITGGTSTVYGSDALAGVINFITKQNYSGFGIEAGISATERGDAETYDLNLAYGHNFADGHGNVTVYANMTERKALFAGEREITGTLIWEDFEGGLVEGGSWTTPAGVVRWPDADLGSGPVQVTFNPDGTPHEFVWERDQYNYAPVNYLQVPHKRYALGAIAQYDLSQNFEGYVEASYVRNEPAANLAPVPAWRFVGVNLDNPVLTPEARQLFTDNYTCDVNLACISFSKRISELGPRIYENNIDYTRIVAGLRGELWRGWDIDGWVTYTRQSNSEKIYNIPSESRYQQGLLVDPVTNECYDPSGGCVPLNVFGAENISAEGVEFIRHPSLENLTERTHKLASVFVTGSPFYTWAGSLDMALGVDWRSDETNFKADDALFTGDTMSLTGESPVQGTEEVFEIYAEAVVPLASDLGWAEYLGLEVGGRYSRHKHAGEVWTYKLGGEWQPLESLRLRTMHQRSVRAPNSSELFEEQRRNITTVIRNDSAQDPCSASRDPVGSGNADKCIIQGLAADQLGIFEATVQYQMEYVSGGNPNLVPETGDTWTVGAVISPEFLSNWVFSIDYFLFEITDTIGGINSVDICFDPVNTGNVFCDNISRDVTGNVAEIVELTSNRGLLETSGIDVQIQYGTDLPEYLALRGDFATVNLNVYWTHLLTHKVQENTATEVLDCSGYFGGTCIDTTTSAQTFSRNRVTSNLHYASGPLGVHLTWRWIEGTHNGMQLSNWYDIPNPILAIPEVGSEHYLDLGFAYEINEHFSTRFGANNLLDNDPPQMADAVWNQTDTGLYDVFGRSYYLTVLVHF